MGSHKLTQRISGRGARRQGLSLCAAFCLGALFFLGTSFAPVSTLADTSLTLATFTADPESPYIPEIMWKNNELYEGPGAHGTGYGNTGAGDGEKPRSQQDSTGLLVQTPYDVSTIRGSELNAIVVPNVTSLFDCTLDIGPPTIGGMGLAAIGPAVFTDLSTGIKMVSQPLGGGTFAIWSTDPVSQAEDDYTLLLSGTIQNAVITGIVGTNSGAAVSATVHYTGGAILAATGHQELYGEFSWNLSNTSSKLSTSGDGVHLNSFEANSMGTFTATVPEPGSLAMLFAAVFGLAAYGWRRHRA